MSNISVMLWLGTTEV